MEQEWRHRSIISSIVATTTPKIRVFYAPNLILSAIRVLIDLLLVKSALQRVVGMREGNVTSIICCDDGISHRLRSWNETGTGEVMLCLRKTLPPIHY